VKEFKEFLKAADLKKGVLINLIGEGGRRFDVLRIVAISLPAIRESAPAPYGLAHFLCGRRPTTFKKQPARFSVAMRSVEAERR